MIITAKQKEPGIQMQPVITYLQKDIAEDAIQEIALKREFSKEKQRNQELSARY